MSYTESKDEPLNLTDLNQSLLSEENEPDIKEYFKSKFSKESSLGVFQANGGFKMKDNDPKIRFKSSHLDSQFMKFPIEEEDFYKYNKAEQMKNGKIKYKLFEPSPFGLKNKTVYDENVRKCFEISPEKFTFENEDYDKALKKAVEETKSSLGIAKDKEIKASPYKLLLYGPGGKFKKHRDTEKEEGMFGTMVVIFGINDFRGGDLLISHGKKTVRIPCPPDGKAHFVSFFADCYHELLPVKYSFRIAMVYNLCYSGRDKGNDKPIIRPPVSQCSEKICEEVPLKKISKIWSRSYQHQKYPFLAHCLEHEYTPTSFKNNKLDNSLFDFKGSDKFINQLIDSEQFHIYIYRFTKIDRGRDDCLNDGYKNVHIYTFYTEEGKWVKDIYHVKIKFEELFYQNTSKTSYPLPDHVKKIINWDETISKRIYLYGSNYYFECPDHEEYEGYMGNHAGTFDEWYNKTLLIFFPKTSYIDLIVNDTSVSPNILAEAIADLYIKKGSIPYKGLEEDVFLKYLETLDTRCYEEDTIDKILPKRLTDLFFVRRNPEKFLVGNTPRVSLPFFRRILQMNRAIPIELSIDIADHNFIVDSRCFLDYFNNRKQRLSFKFWKKWITFTNGKSGIDIFFGTTRFSRNYIAEQVNVIAINSILDLHNIEMKDKWKINHYYKSYCYLGLLDDEEKSYYYDDDEDNHKKAVPWRFYNRKDMELNDTYFTDKENLDLILKFLSSFHEGFKKNKTNPEKSPIPAFLRNQPKYLINFSIIKNLLLLDQKLSNVQMRNCLKIMTGKFCEILKNRLNEEFYKKVERDARTRTDIDIKEIYLKTKAPAKYRIKDNGTKTLDEIQKIFATIPLEIREDTFYWDAERSLEPIRKDLFQKYHNQFIEESKKFNFDERFNTENLDETIEAVPDHQLKKFCREILTEDMSAIELSIFLVKNCGLRSDHPIIKKLYLSCLHEYKTQMRKSVLNMTKIEIGILHKIDRNILKILFIKNLSDNFTKYNYKKCKNLDPTFTQDDLAIYIDHSIERLYRTSKNDMTNFAKFIKEVLAVFGEENFEGCEKSIDKINFNFSHFMAVEYPNRKYEQTAYNKLSEKARKVLLKEEPPTGVGDKENRLISCLGLVYLKVFAGAAHLTDFLGGPCKFHMK